MEEIAFKITVDTEVGNLSIGELKEGFRGLKEELAKTQIGTEKYKQTLTKMGEVQGSLKDLKDDIKALDPDAKFKSLAGIAGSITNGFQAAQGAVGLFGAESEELGKIILKVQSATALAQGVNGLKGFTDSFRQFSLVLKANPYEAIAAAVGLAVIATVQLIDKWIASNSESAKMATAIEKLTKVYDEQTRILDNQIKVLEAQKGKEEEIIKAKRERIVVGIKEAELSLFLAEAKKKEANQEQTLLDITLKYLNPDLLAARKKLREAEAAKEVKENKDKLDVLVADLKVNFIQEENLTKEKNDKASEERAKQLEKIIADLSKESEARKTFTESNYYRLLGIQERYQEDSLKSLQDFAFRQVEIEDKKDEELFNKTAATQQRIADATIAAKTNLMMAEFGLAEASLQLLGQAAGKHKKLSDAIFAVEKAVAIAKIIVSTIAEIRAIHLKYAAVPGGEVVSAIESNIARIQAATGIATIVGTTIGKFMGGGGGVSSSSFGSPSPGGGGAPPSINTPSSNPNVNSTNVNTNSNGDFTGFGNQKSIKAYVVETEITQSQKNIQTIKNKTTY